MADWATIASRWRITPAVALVGAFLILAAGVTVAFYEEHLYRVQAVHEESVQASILAASMSAALTFNDRKAAQEYTDALKANPDVEAVGVYTSEGALFAGFARPGARPLPKTAHPRPVDFEANQIVVAAPVSDDGQQLGTVYLRSTTEPVERRIARYAGIILLVTMTALVLGVLATAQVTLANANSELGRQADDLAEANRRLQLEMAEREKAEDALRQSQKMEAIGQLSGGIAHDFNNLLTIIKGNLQLLQKRLAQGRTDVQRYLDSATEGLNRAASLTQRILAFSRRQPLSPRPVNLSALVDDMGELLRHSVGEDIRIETHLNSNWWTLCDANQMENVILNLAINARDAMPNGGSLTIETANLHVREDDPMVETTMPGDYVRLSMSDTGVGMSEDVRERAIDPFFTTKPQGQGTGLGLSMTFGYIRQSNGHLTIDSEVGKGTTINILMPRHAAAIVMPAGESEGAEALNGIAERHSG